MSHFNGNRLATHGQNDYFMGVLSAITPQSEVTVNVNFAGDEMLARRKNMDRDISRAKSYQGGDNTENLHVLQHEAVYGWISRQGRNAVPGNPSQVGFTSLNGIKWGAYSTNEELESRLRFIGIAKGCYFVDDKAQLKHGFACRAAGTDTTFNTGEDDIHPGDMIEWRVVPRPTGNPAIMPGGQFGDGGAGTRQGTPWHGTPHGKLRFRTVVSRFNDVTPPLNHAVSAMLKDMAHGGIADRPFEQLFSPGALSPDVIKMRPNEEFAMSLLVSDVVTIARGIDILKRALPGWETLSETQLVNAIGVFNPKRDAAAENVRKAIIGGLYMGMPGGGQASRTGFVEFRARHPGGFVQGRGEQKLSRIPGNLESQYCQVATQLGRYKELAMARSVHAVSRRTIGMALCSSTKGQRLDLLMGMFLRTF